MRPSRSCLRALCALFLCSFCTFAQRTTANVYGIVKDQSGALIAGVTVLFTNEGTNTEVSATSNAAGEFSATFLPIGRYTLRAHAEGFKTFVEKGLELVASQQLRYPITLELGQVSQQVEVSAEAPLLQNASVQLSDRLNRAQLDHLPATNRDFTTLLTLQTGVAESKDKLYTVNGLASAGISITVDGVDASGNAESPLLGMFQSRNMINVISQEAIQEVSVSKGVISADVSRTMSGNFNIISKGGTNQFHGSLFENLRNDRLNARNALLAPTTAKPNVRFNQFGGSLGGPVWKDRAFFFFAYEGYRQSNLTIVTGQTPTPEFKAKAIAAVPEFKAALDMFPNPTESYAAGAASANYQGVQPARANDDTLLFRGDYNLGSNDRLSARYQHGHPFNGAPTMLAANPQEWHFTNDSVYASWVHSAASWTSETRGGYNSSHTLRQQAYYPTGTSAFQLQGGFSFAAGVMEIIGHSYSMEEVFAKTTGRHTIKFGAIHFVQTPGRHSEKVPVLRYGSAADMLANKPNRVTLTLGNPLFHGRAWHLGGFVQDDFKLRPNLLLNLGVRYEYYSVFKSAENNLFNIGKEANAFQNPPVYRPQGSFYNPDHNNILPRLGLAWSPGGSTKTTLRGGFGMSVGAFDLRNFYTYVGYDEKVISDYTFSGSDLTTYNIKYPLTNANVLSWIRNPVVPRAFAVFDQDTPNPAAMQWTVDLQRQLTPTLVAQAGYVGTHGYHISLLRYFNQPDRQTGLRPNSAVLESYSKVPVEKSDYHGLNLALRKRLSHDFQLNANYTWSKNLALGSGDYYGGNESYVQDSAHPEADHGPTAYDRTHFFTLDGTWSPRVDRWLRLHGPFAQALGGWQVGSILRAATGDPLTVLQASSFLNSRPDFTGAVPYASSSDKYTFLNPAAFVAVPLSTVGKLPVRPGSVGKGSLRGPGRWGADLSLGKSLTLRERYKFTFRAEMMNSLNRVNLLDPIVESTQSDFGKVRSVEDARIIQMSLRFAF